MHRTYCRSILQNIQTHLPVPPLHQPQLHLLTQCTTSTIHAAVHLMADKAKAEYYEV